MILIRETVSAFTKKDDSGRESHKVRVITTDEKGNRWIDVPLGFSQGDSVYLLQTKSMSKRYKRVLPQDLAPFRKQPGPEKLPVLDLTPLAKNELNWFPEGLYVQVSTIADAHVVQSIHPVRVVLELNSETSYDLLNKDLPEKPVLPYSKKMVIISLDPFVPGGTEAQLRETLDKLIEKGYTTFIANNLAHIAMLRGKKVNVIAGQYLYTFNKWAVSFLENQNIMAVQTPVENSERNLEKTFATSQERSRVLINVFAYPALFRLRFKLPSNYDFTYFTDKEHMQFKVNSTPDGSFVMPEYPFSIIDKLVTLKNKGWTHQLIDFSKTKVSRSDLKTLTALINTHEPVQGASRFNWKDGFYDPEKIEAYQNMAERALEEQKNPSRRHHGGKKSFNKKRH